jgi:DNA-binding NarL/FixJ family response regulator
VEWALREEAAHNESEARLAKGGEMARVVALMDDLFFQMKVAETAKHLGLELKVAGNADSLMELVGTGPKLVIVDLNARSGAIAAIERVKAATNGVRMVGFLSHVQTDLAAQARAAGCDEVMPRSSFTQNLAAILAGAKE